MSLRVQCGSKNTSSMVKPIQCETCGQTFTRPSNYKRHLSIHSNVKPFECEQCGRRFRCAWFLKEHKNKHLNSKLFVCAICNGTFTHRTTLRHHLFVHSGEKPLACELCGKRFVKNYNLKLHKRLHTGNLPFECGGCGKRFNTKANLQSHSFVHTRVHPFECDVCGCGFRKKNKLLQHYVTHSNSGSESHRREQEGGPVNPAPGHLEYSSPPSDILNSDGNDESTSEIGPQPADSPSGMFTGMGMGSKESSGSSGCIGELCCGQESTVEATDPHCGQEPTLEATDPRCGQESAVETTDPCCGLESTVEAADPAIEYGTSTVVDGERREESSKVDSSNAWMCDEERRTWTDYSGIASLCVSENADGFSHSLEADDMNFEEGLYSRASSVVSVGNLPQPTMSISASSVETTETDSVYTSL